MSTLISTANMHLKLRNPTVVCASETQALVFALRLRDPNLGLCPARSLLKDQRLRPCV